MSDELRKKSIHDLRIMAQAFGVADIFEKDAAHLVQEIEAKQEKLFTPPLPTPPKPEYDARLMTKPPSKRSNAVEITELLAEHIRMGLTLTFDEESWFMSSGKKNDSGSVRMPLKDVLGCADRVLR